MPPPLDTSLEGPEEPSSDVDQAEKRRQSNDRDTHSCEQFTGVLVDRLVLKERHPE